MSKHRKVEPRCGRCGSTGDSFICKCGGFRSSYECCRCGKLCSGSLGIEDGPICNKCAKRLYPKQHKAWDRMVDLLKTMK